MPWHRPAERQTCTRVTIQHAVSSFKRDVGGSTPPDEVADLDLPALRGREPVGDMGTHHAVLQLHICPKRLAREERKERFADGLVRGAVHEGQVVGAQDGLGRGVHGH